MKSGVQEGSANKDRAELPKDNECDNLFERTRLEHKDEARQKHEK